MAPRAITERDAIDLDWEQMFWWATGLSLGALVITAAGIPWVVARLPHDYFSRPARAAWRTSDHPPMYALILGVLKNVVGAVLVLLGLIMLVTPGQGLLTLLIGLLLMNFPGKYQVERWLVTRRGVMRALNWLRRRHGERPFDAPRSMDGRRRLESPSRAARRRARRQPR